MLIQLAGAGLISEETGIEKNTESSPDEKVRRQKEKDEALRLKEKELSLQYGSNASGDSDSHGVDNGSDAENVNEEKNGED